MAIWYCDYLNGNDANPGTELSPKQTIQATVNIMTGGDRCKIANTLLHPITSLISFNTGFVTDNTKYTKFEAWDNGGGITTQRPDELVARVAATISSQVNGTFSSTNFPTGVVFENIKFVGTNASNTLVNTHGTESHVFSGCEFDTSNLSGSAQTVLANTGTIITNCYYKLNNNVGSSSLTTAGYIFVNNYIEGIVVVTTGLTMGANSFSVIANNIFDYSNATTTGTYTMINYNQRTSHGVFGNTFIANSSYPFIGINNSATTSRSKIFNNIFYKFDNASSKPITSASGNQVSLAGHNAFYDSNASDVFNNIGVDLTANDITGTGDPFVDSTNNSYTLIPSLRGTGLSSPNSFVDIGAVQSRSEVIIPSTDQNQYRANRSCE